VDCRGGVSAVVGKVVEFGGLRGMREGCGEVLGGSRAVGKFVIRLVGEEGK
jgi:hypothetical protein